MKISNRIVFKIAESTLHELSLVFTCFSFQQLMELLLHTSSRKYTKFYKVIKNNLLSSRQSAMTAKFSEMKCLLRTSGLALVNHFNKVCHAPYFFEIHFAEKLVETVE